MRILPSKITCCRCEDRDAEYKILDKKTPAQGRRKVIEAGFIQARNLSSSDSVIPKFRYGSKLKVRKAPLFAIWHQCVSKKMIRINKGLAVEIHRKATRTNIVMVGKDLKYTECCTWTLKPKFGKKWEKAKQYYLNCQRFRSEISGKLFPKIENR